MLTTYTNQTMMNEDVSLAYISRGLGHASLATTSNYLDKFRDRKVKEAGDRLMKYTMNLKSGNEESVTPSAGEKETA